MAKASKKGSGKKSKPSTKKQSASPEPQVRPGSSPDAAPVSHDAIALRAWEIWQSEGCPEGRARENWAQAERELQGWIAAQRDVEGAAA